MNDENGAERKNTSSNSGGYVIYILNWDPEIIMGKKKKKKRFHFLAKIHLGSFHSKYSKERI